MILVDTSIWIDHLRSSNAALASLLMAGQVLLHPFVIGELALGSVQRRDSLLDVLNCMPRVTVASDAEVMMFINQNKLYGRGIGYIDAHLLASVRLTPGTRLWSRDKRLGATAEQLGLLVSVEH